MYRIKYTYDTGSSFHNEYGLESHLEFEWDSLEIAKANLKRIEEHYKVKDVLKGLDFIEQHEALKAFEVKDWFVSEKRCFAYNKKESEGRRHPYYYIPVDSEKDKKKLAAQGYEFYEGYRTDLAEHSLKLQMDNGKFVQIGAPWCGYFESLTSVEIETDNHKIVI